jgi:hypothetical protein
MEDRTVNRGFLLALALPALMAATPSMATPAGFGCYKPIVELPENRAVSRYMYNEEDHVFDLKVYLNAASTGDGISLGPKALAACKIILPVGGYLRQQIEWGPAKPADRNAVYKSIRIQEAGGGGAMTDWLVLRPKSQTVSGFTTIEFHVHVNYPDPGE